jgi:hypothetical protein
MITDSAYLTLAMKGTAEEQAKVINELDTATEEELQKVVDADVPKLSVIAMTKLVRLKNPTK